MSEVSEHLARVSDDASLNSVILSIATACGRIAGHLQADVHMDKVGTVNSSGDAQLGGDLVADREIFEALQANRAVHSAASEESPEISVLHEDGNFSVVFDPLDGSSVVDCAWTVGALFSVYPGNFTNKVPGRAQKAAIMAVFGPRTVIVIGLVVSDRKSLLTATLCDGRFLVGESEISPISGRAKIFSPANLRAAADSPEYKNFIDQSISQRLTLRYSGALVPDIFQIFVKSHGIFVSPVSVAAPAKLRLGFEIAPVALLLEIAGGRAYALSVDAATPVLDLPVSDFLDRRLGFIGGSADSVEEALDSLKLRRVSDL